MEGLSLRVGSWNVNEGMSVGHLGFDYWAELRRQNLEVVCLQEVGIPRSAVEKNSKALRIEDRVCSEMVAAYLKRHSGYAYCAGLVLSESTYLESHYQAIAVLSRYRLVSDATEYRLRSSDFDLENNRGERLHDKGAVAVSLLVGGQRIRVLCLHGFPLHRFNRSAGTREFSSLLSRVGEIIELEAVKRGERGRLFVAGDFNFDRRPHRIPGFKDWALQSVTGDDTTRVVMPGSCSSAVFENLDVKLFDEDQMLLLSHDDILVGESWICETKLYPTKSDHQLVTVSAYNDQLPRAQYGSCTGDGQWHAPEAGLVGRVRGSQLPPSERIHQDRSDFAAVGR